MPVEPCRTSTSSSPASGPWAPLPSIISLAGACASSASSRSAFPTATAPAEAIPASFARPISSIRTTCLLLERAYAGWRGLEADAGEALLHTVGTVYIGRPDSALVDGSRRSAAAHGLALEALTGDELARRFPPFCCPDGYQALFEPDAGFVLCERAIRAQVARALDHGATIAVGQRLVSWRATGDGVEVTTDTALHHAGGLVLTVGSWSGGVLKDLGVPLEVTRQPLFWVQPGGHDFDLGRCPCWAVQRPDRAGLFYGFPALPGSLAAGVGVKVAHHAPGEPADPDAPRGEVRPGELRAVLSALVPFLRGLGNTPTGTHVCLYTNSADGHFIVDRHPHHDRVAFGCGFTGHGFKFAPAIGEALADLVMEGKSALPVDFLKLRSGRRE